MDRQPRIKPPRSAWGALLLLVGCAGGVDTPGNADATGALLPDTSTVEGVLHMRHGVEALGRAPQWSIDSVPIMRIDGGDEFDLSDTRDVVLLSDGRAVAMRPFNGSGLMLFDTTGSPVRLIARSGAGPGELTAPVSLIALAGDTLVTADMSTQRVSWFTPDSGLVRSEPMAEAFPGYCFRPGGMLTNRRLVATGGCSTQRMLPDGTLRAETPLVTFGLDFVKADTVALVKGSRMVMVEVQQGDQRIPAMTWLRLGQPTTVAAFDSTVVVGSGDGGYALELYRPSGTRFGRIIVDAVPRFVDDQLRQRIIDEQMSTRDLPSGDPGAVAAIRRAVVAETPIADTIAPYGQVLVDADNTIWVISLRVPGESGWSAWAFRADGALVARIEQPRSAGHPVWFGPDRVMLREVDEDGVVRFGVYRLTREPE